MSGKARAGAGAGGFTLLELMVAMFIALIVVSGVFMNFVSQRETYLGQETIAESQGNLRAGMSLLKRDLRNAGFVLDDANSMVTTNNAGLNASDTITVFSNGLGEDRIHYEIKTVGGLSTLIRNTDPAGNVANDIPVIPNAEDLQLAYGWDVNGNNVIDAGEWLNDATGSEASVEAIRINLLVRAAKPDPAEKDFVRPALEDHAAAGTPDAFARRLLTSIVRIRNKGL